MPFSDNTRGAVYMTGSMAAFAVNDTFMKLTFETMPLAQGVFLRGLVASLILLLLAWRSGALAFRPSRRQAVGLATRSLGEAGGTVTFMIAIASLPLATAGAVLQVAPLAVTLAAAMFLGEPVGWRRWAAIGLGFGGVLVMVRPGTEAFDPMMAFPLLTVGCIVLRDIVTRRLSPVVPAVYAACVTSVLMTAIAAVLIPLEGWRPPSAATLALYAGAAVFVLVGYIFSVSSMRIGDVSAVSPFRYTVLLFSIILGYLAFGDIPDVATFVGAGIVSGAGLYTLWRETKVSRMKPATNAPLRAADAE